MSFSLLSLLSVGFGLGLLHALDADHVMAISTLCNNKPRLRRTLSFCLRWAFGHSIVLLTSAFILLQLGISLSPELQKVAEISVGVLLIVLGAWCFYRLHRDDLSLIHHSHGKLTHRHWMPAKVLTSSEKLGLEHHAPMFVGVLHGLAGSAPAIALIPIVVQGNFVVAISYLIIFCLGVTLAMLAFGLGWGSVQRLLDDRFKKVHKWIQRLVASASMLVGGYWLTQAL